MELGTLSYRWARRYLALYAKWLFQQSQVTQMQVYQEQCQILDAIVAQMHHGAAIRHLLEEIDDQTRDEEQHAIGMATARMMALAQAREVLVCVPRKEE